MLKSREIINEYWRCKIERAKPKTKEWILSSICDAYGVTPPFNADSLIKLYRVEPSFLFIHVLDVVPWTNPLHPYSDQLAILEAARTSQRIAVRSGHKVSKSNTLAGIALWYSLTRPRARVPITSASYSQVRKINWYELRNMYYGAEKRGIEIGGVFYEDPQSGLKFGDGREVFGFSTKEAERAAGISGENIFYLVDEASGVEEFIFEAIEGNRAGGAAIAMFSNPTRTSGTFYNSFHSKRQFWTNIHISSEYTPNCQAGRPIIPGLALPEWCEEKKQEWGEDSPLYHVRVKGNFPPQGPNAVIPLELVEQSQGRYRMWIASEMPYEGDLTIGVDPAYYGDDEAVIYGVRGNVAILPKVLNVASGEQIAQEVIEYIKRNRQGAETVRVNIDVNGEGRAVFEVLAFNNSEMMRNMGAFVCPVNVSEISDYPDEYYNKRTQLCFGLRDWMQSGGMLPDDPKLEAELVSVNYVIDPKGRYKLPLKEKEKETLGRSPDRRNALELATYSGRNYDIEYRSAGKRTVAGRSFSNFMRYE